MVINSATDYAPIRPRRSAAPKPRRTWGTRTDSSFRWGRTSLRWGALVLKKLEERTGIYGALRRLPSPTSASPPRSSHSLLDLITQRVFGLALATRTSMNHDDLRAGSDAGRGVVQGRCEGGTTAARAGSRQSVGRPKARSIGWS